jgi:hypothetical protein
MWFHLTQVGSCEHGKELADSVKGYHLHNYLPHLDSYPFKAWW